MEWSPYPAWNWIAAGVCVLFAVIAWRTLRAPHGPPLGRRLLWLVLRGALLALLLAILLHPHRVERREFREPQDVAVLLDDSASMSLRDAPGCRPGSNNSRKAPAHERTGRGRRPPALVPLCR